jgi:hypothetical protein
LPVPRSLGDEETRLLQYLLGQVGVESLDTQLLTAKVVSECSCGCPSIGLASEGPAVSPAIMRQLSDADRDDWLEINAWGENVEGKVVQVNLHLVNGRLHELEIWSGWDGGEAATTLLSVTTVSASPER